MRSFRVVELYDAGHEFLGIFKIMGRVHPIKPFLLDDAVHPFRYGIVRRPVVLRHADGGMDTLLFTEPLNIFMHFSLKDFTDRAVIS